MKTQTGVVSIIVLALSTGYAPWPPAAVLAAEKSGQLVQAQAGGSTTGLVVITAPNLLPGRTLHGAIIKGGLVQSQHGRRVHGLLVLDLQMGDIVSLSVPYGEPAAELSGTLTYSLKPGGQIYVQARRPVGQEVFVTVAGQKTDTIVFNTK